MRQMRFSCAGGFSQRRHRGNPDSLGYARVLGLTPVIKVRGSREPWLWATVALLCASHRPSAFGGASSLPPLEKLPLGIVPRTRKGGLIRYAYPSGVPRRRQRRPRPSPPHPRALSPRPGRQQRWRDEFPRPATPVIAAVGQPRWTNGQCRSNRAIFRLAISAAINPTGTHRQYVGFVLPGGPQGGNLRGRRGRAWTCIRSGPRVFPRRHARHALRCRGDHIQ